MFESKITHTRGQENLNLKEKRQLTTTVRWQMLELSDKDLKAAIIKMCQQAIMNTLQSLHKEIENIRNHLELKIN